jgi:hypothetical protein
MDDSSAGASRQKERATTPTTSELISDKELKSILDRTTLATDLVKHISTLASGSIILLATFLSLSKVPLKDFGVLIYGIGLLVVCIVCCVSYLGFFGIKKTWVLSNPVLASPWEVRLAIGVFGSFCIGLILVGISVFRTLQG